MGAVIRPAIADSRTCLHIAVQLGHYRLTRAILQYTLGTEDLKNAPDAFGQTPLHIAAQKGDAGMVALLLKFNADPHPKDRNGRTPKELALLNNCEEDVIEQFGFEDMIEKHRGATRRSPAKTGGMSGDQLHERLDTLSGDEGEAGSESANLRRMHRFVSRN
jgi:hypothetical protein